MAVKVTQKEPHARILMHATKTGPEGRLVAGSLTLEPDVPKYVDEELWKNIEEGSHHPDPKTGKRTSTIETLVKAGAITVEKGVTDPTESGAGTSRVTRGEVPPQHAISLPGQGGEDNTRREDAEADADKKKQRR